jgi:hypothetical protein
MIFFLSADFLTNFLSANVFPDDMEMTLCRHIQFCASLFLDGKVFAASVHFRLHHNFIHFAGPSRPYSVMQAVTRTRTRTWKVRPKHIYRR